MQERRCTVPSATPKRTPGSFRFTKHPYLPPRRPSYNNQRNVRSCSLALILFSPISPHPQVQCRAPDPVRLPFPPVSCVPLIFPCQLRRCWPMCLENALDGTTRLKNLPKSVPRSGSPILFLKICFLILRTIAATNLRSPFRLPLSFQCRGE